MDTIIFDGRGFAEEKREELKIVVAGLRSRGIIPHLASILIGNDEASRLYVELKKKATEKVGAELNPYFLPEKTELSTILTLINSLNSDENIHGIMVQLPIPGKLGESKDEIIEAIDSKKDVDGLKKDSLFLHPTSKAVIDILDFALSQISQLTNQPITICVVGATGMVGTPLVKRLKVDGYKVIGVDSKTENLETATEGADVVVSATGIPGLIKPEMVKEGVVAIDVGSPSGDFAREVQKKAAFFTPVPGGVGPVTIACLLENLIDAC